MLLITLWFVLNTFAADCAQKSNTQNCVQGKCEVIGETEICAQCNQGNVPINGECVGAEGAKAKCTTAEGDGNQASDQTCGKCLQQTFMYKGGCYDTTGIIGQTICKTLGGTAGKCEACNADNGFFTNPDATSTIDSCISCGDAAGITIGKDNNAKTYKGVSGCAKCTAPKQLSQAAGTAVAICTECTAELYLKTVAEITSCITIENCNTGFFPMIDKENENKKLCTKCSETNKGGIADCNECIPRTDDPTKGKCTACTGDKKPNLEGTECNVCTGQNCAFCVSGGACEGCSSGFILDGENCVKSDCKTENCKACTDPKAAGEICTECISTHYLTPTSQCVQYCQVLGNYYDGANADNKKTCKECTIANCKECTDKGQCQTCNDGFYKNGGACSPCHESCKTCSAGTANDCTECPVEKILKYTGDKGACIPQCVVNAAEASGNCKACELVIEGTKYCSTCSKSDEYPQDGICTVKAARVATCKDGSITSGVCKQCADDYFLMNGGCYEAGRYPGKAVCTAAQVGGTCKATADGYKLDGGTLTACSEGCKTCTSDSICDACKNGYVKVSNSCKACSTGCATCNTNPETCTACLVGYYQSESKCIACDKDDSAIKGISNCLNCVPPSSNTGSVLCYLMKNDGTGGSTNRSGLSTGAIAGIAVAVIVVVGGLIGFLCWWFICRGKA
ncbi:VSP [Giardia lamblia P15]|uniref:VSP n=1 Tax=Giardia intestinalis (strain P15) TaxID=658858 RepID=E1F591_GIAIA|nr:VSP [Giardia lamblia P15]